MRHKTAALAEVILVFFMVLISFQAMQLLPIVGNIASVPLRLVPSYLVVALIPLALLAFTRKRFIDYGIVTKNPKNDLKTVVISLIPVLIIKAAAFVMDWHQWPQALLLALVGLGAFFLLAWMLKKMPGSPGRQLGLFFIVFIPGTVVGLTSSPANVLLRAIYMFGLVGLAEEIFFRGYIQPRLNMVFRQSYSFFGIRLGWGILIASLIFAFWHILNPLLFNPFLGQFSLSWQHGLWTFPLGLAFGLVREKTGNIFAPAILHGLVNV